MSIHLERRLKPNDFASTHGLRAFLGGALTPSNEQVLIETYRRNVNDYERRWKAVDDELYLLCSRRDQRTFQDVFAKVAIINRVYMAGLLRILGRGGEEAVAEVLSSDHEQVRSAFQRLESEDAFSISAAHSIVEIHGEITAAIAARTNGRWVTSFVSKYLHFHAPQVPVYDTRVNDNIRRWVFGRQLSEARKALPPPTTTYSNAYYEYLFRFLALHQQLLQLDLGKPVTVKGIDSMLW